ncbi:MAG TPA: hypothetical protein VL598_02130 [Trinickia sp.]|jgi:hypothetical protein|uniref:hypothetical protein n=1 Tax=Trinickia sp. TaxID=2571163 RepID=UPI002C39F8F2|nr:hypothetical protein [Trinickia sp.]HTI16443.1 hypothetical protein [Trinickia sp.]
MAQAAWPRARAQAIAIALAGAFVGMIGFPQGAHANPHRRGAFDLHLHRLPRAHREHSASSAGAPIMGTNTLLDFDTTQRDGHMTPEERRLLRQHIEEAVRELYKR